MQQQLTKAALIALLASLGACATPPPPKVVQTSCAMAHLPVQLSMAGSLEGFDGQYSDGVRSLSLRQDGYVVLIADANSQERELRKTGEWRFEDACGVTYQLSLPLDGTGASLQVISPSGRSMKLRRVRRG